ncbi:VCBS repeat-containing protein [Pontibacter diazotrophicus]|uniref:VCBS repeat-containing protein n=1 Tax=Pontibacter diazotrophicus TaxID=1400979 RepID=UPI0015F1994F|nr:VCBS repeat-containing protein [Pontibacter diazotrophicus]
MLFELLAAEETGISFNNKLPENDTLNAMQFDYLYNGGGVAVGDINNDGLEDIYFTGNKVSGKLYLNKGNLKFEDITDKAGVATERWSTGVAMVDINQDGFLDIYICMAGPVEEADMANLLFINNGNNTFNEAAKAYGLADTGYSTHAAFLDYDRDGDLDMYLLTNAREEQNRNLVRPKTNDGLAKSTDRLYRNNGNNTFTNVSQKAGINIEGYGLGVGISDINQDGWPDVYVANDFITNDLLWINNGDGTFSDKINQYLSHQSYNGMGTDIADINNDGYQEIMVLDMLPEENKHQKTMLMPANYDRFMMNLELGYEPQYVRNSLQLNNGNGTFSEIGQLAGVSNTDWSWGPLFADFDNDGYRDILVTNGYRKDVTNLDFATYTVGLNKFGTEEANKKEFTKELKKLEGTKTHNYIYRNNKDLTFTDMSEAWGLSDPSYSNGGAYADLDNDGDLDMVVNNIDEEAFVYQNRAESFLKNNFLKVKFKGTAQNRFGIGAKLKLAYGNKQQVYEHYTHKGYKSTVYNIAHFGLGKDSLVQTLEVIWPDGKSQVLQQVKPNQLLTLDYNNATAKPIAPKPLANILFKEVSDDLGIKYDQKEASYDDFKQEFLLPHKLSQNGPGIAVGDADGNGLEDFYVGGATQHTGMLFLQDENGNFASRPFAKEGTQEEDMGVLFFDADNDGDLDLYVVSGGVENPAGSSDYQDRLYKNDGNGKFALDAKALPATLASGSCVTAADYDRDGDLDLFVGGRVVPGKYPLPAQSYLLQNNGGKFKDVTRTAAKSLTNLGLVTSAIWTDFNQDKQVDLIVVGEWMPVTFFQNKNGVFTDVTAETGLQHTSGWWNNITGADFDGDGDIDYVAGNLGLNSKYKGSAKEPVCIYAKDFDSNGSIDPILFYYIQGKNHPTHPRDGLTSQIVGMRKRFPTYAKYGEATLEDMFLEEELEDAYVVRGEYFKTSYMENLGNGKFKIKALPMQAQFGPVFGISTKDFDGDNKLDLLLIGNSYATEVLTGWYDGLIGLYLKGDGKGGFTPVSVNQSGFMVKEDGKALTEITSAKGETLVLAAVNQGPLRVFKTNNAIANKPVKLEPQDAYGIVTTKDGKKQRYEFYYGGSYLSQGSRTWQLPANATAATIYNYKGKGRSIAPTATIVSR